METVSKQHRLRTSLEGDLNEVRSFDTNPDGTFIATVSRDYFCTFWTIQDDGINYQRGNSFICSSAVPLVIKYCPMNIFCPVDSVFIGGMSKIMSQFSTVDYKLLIDFKYHEGAISCIEFLSETILSGSWDFSICQWDFTGKMLYRFQYHSASVLCLCPTDQGFLSGSGDCLIHLWVNTYTKNTYSGHEVPVRCIKLIPNSKYFLSGGNDGSVKKWHIDSTECIDSFSAHAHFIYSLDLLRMHDSEEFSIFVSGEEKYINIWTNKTLKERIILPYSSSWLVKCLPNSDVLVCCASKNMYIFTNNETRFADNAKQLEFQKLISDNVKPSDIEGINIDTLLPSEEGILIPGKKDGQLKMFREGNKVVVYKWELNTSTWVLIGDAVSKQAQEEIEIAEAVPPYTIDVELPNKSKRTLTYKSGQDPMEAAEAFILENELGSEYTGEIYEFLLKNIPAAAAHEAKRKKAKSTPENNIPAAKTIDPPSINFPLRNYIFFKTTNVDGMFKKILDINSESKIEENPDPIILSLHKYVESTINGIPINFTSDEFPWDFINKLITASKNAPLVPLLDLLKQLVLIPEFYQRFFLQNNNIYQMSSLDFFRNFTDEHCDSTSIMLVCRCFCNMFIHQSLSNNLQEICSNIVPLQTSMHFWVGSNCQIASASLLHNFSILLYDNSNKIGNESIDNFLTNVLWLLEILCAEISEEATFRLITAIGNIISIPSFQLSSSSKKSFAQLSEVIKTSPKLANPKIKSLLDKIFILSRKPSS